MSASKNSSTAQRVNSSYRRLIALDQKMDLLTAQFATIKTLADHVARLIREKEILQKQLEQVIPCKCAERKAAELKLSATWRDAVVRDAIERDALTSHPLPGTWSPVEGYIPPIAAPSPSCEVKWADVDRCSKVIEAQLREGMTHYLGERRPNTAHVYDSAGKRCMRCSCLREAVEASGTSCEVPA